MGPRPRKLLDQMRDTIRLKHYSNSVSLHCSRSISLHVKRLHKEDLAKGYGAVYLPHALERKYPNASRERT